MSLPSPRPPQHPSLAGLVHSYDIRGPALRLLEPGTAAALGSAFAAVVDAAGGDGVLVARDMRTSSPALHAGLVEGITRAGADVLDLGLAATEVLYFASGDRDLPGAVVTASHNPANDNGVKFCRSGARPVGEVTGLSDIARLWARFLTTEPAPAGSSLGSVRRCDLLSGYAAHVRALVPVGGRRLRVVVDAGNAMAATTVPAVFDRLDVDLQPLYFDLDGRFPNHLADPLDPANLVDLRAAVVAGGADLGLAFDGDGDRCFVVDELGEPVSSSVVTALIAARELSRRPGSPVVHNAVCSRVVPATIQAAGGVAVRTPVGHSTIKAVMAQRQAVFGGEHSGHYYFRDFWYADSGMLAALHVLASVASSDRPLSEVVAPYRRYAHSGELNFGVDDAEAALLAVEREFCSIGSADHLDGVTIGADAWWFNLRASNTEPLVRLNVEADDQATMEEVRDRVLAILRSPM